jgi:hypothetical protein
MVLLSIIVAPPLFVVVVAFPKSEEEEATLTRRCLSDEVELDGDETTEGELRVLSNSLDDGIDMDMLTSLLLLFVFGGDCRGL